jgi:hypothetical protein
MERDFLSAWFVAMMELAHDAGDRDVGADEITNSRSAASFTIARIQTSSSARQRAAARFQARNSSSLGSTPTAI